MNLLFVILIGLASSFVTIWQSGRILPLIDYSYQVENAYRIYLGQIPYRDFVLVLPPGTYYIIALIMKIFGLANIYQVLYIALLSFLTVILTYALLCVFNKNKRLNVFFLIPLIFAGHSMYPFPSYDVNATFFMLLGLYCLSNIILKKNTYFHYCYFTGILLALPLFFKQNTGLIFLLSSLSILLIYKFLTNKKISNKSFLCILFGTISPIILLLLFLLKNNALSDFWFQLFLFPSRVRSPLSAGFQVIFDFLSVKNLILYISFFLLGIYAIKNKLKKTHRNIFLSLAIAVPLFLYPLIYSFLISLNQIRFDSFKLIFNFSKNFYSLFFSFWYVILLLLFLTTVIDFSANKVRGQELFVKLLAVLLALCISTSFLSQGVIGSTYGIYPLLMLLVSAIFNSLSHNYVDVRWQYFFIFFVFLITFFLSIYIYFNGRIFYIERSGELLRFTNEKFKPLATPGEWIGNMEMMFRYVEKNIPQKDSVIALPGEDPFYYATDRKPVLKYFQYFYQTFPFSKDQYIADILNNRIDWIIIKNPLQYTKYNASQEIVSRLSKVYSQYKIIKGYIIYKRIL